MKINVICFTEKGLILSQRIKEKMEQDYEICLFAKYEKFMQGDSTALLVEEKLSEWTKKRFLEQIPLLFIGATGIAVRAIADSVKDKLLDIPVLVADELGTFVIPILSGHMGGANSLAVQIAEYIDAVPVITTATDLEGTFSVDVFAREHQLAVMNREGIAKVSAKALEGKPVRLSIENYPATDVDVVVGGLNNYCGNSVLQLCPRPFAVGIGCRKGIGIEQLHDFIIEQLSKNEIDVRLIGAIGSIDLKAEEEAILSFSRKYKLPFITFSSDLLRKARGSYEESEFVETKTGIGNVCERAAMLLTGNQGEIILHKTIKQGMTIAIAKVGD